MGYHVVFDISRNGGNLAILAIPLLFLLILALVGWHFKDSDDSQEALKGTIFKVGAACGMVFSLFFFVSSLSEFLRARDVLASGRYRVAEGAVKDFVPMPPGGHSIEHFRVGDASFQYGAGWGSVVFNSEWNRGFIHEGAEVRIAFNGSGEILRIEEK